MADLREGHCTLNTHHPRDRCSPLKKHDLWPPVSVAFRYDREVDLVTTCARPLILPFQSVCRTRSVDGMTLDAWRASLPSRQAGERICARGLRNDVRDHNVTSPDVWCDLSQMNTQSTLAVILRTRALLEIRFTRARSHHKSCQALDVLCFRYTTFFFCIGWYSLRTCFVVTIRCICCLHNLLARTATQR